MKILSLMELAKEFVAQYGVDEAVNRGYVRLAEDRYGNPMQDKNGENTYILTSKHQSMDDLLEGKDHDEIRKLSKKNRAFNLQLKNFNIEGIEDSTWAQFTAEEIINMHDNGAIVPDDILQNAYDEINNSDINSEIDLSEKDAIDNGNFDLNSNLTSMSVTDMRKLAATAMFVCENKEKDLEVSIDEMDLLEAELTRIEKETEDKQLDTIEEMQKIADEWQVYKNKIDSGFYLSESEQKRFEELGGIFNDINGDYEKNLNRDIDKLQSINKKLSDKNTVIKKVQLAGEEAIKTAESFDINVPGKLSKFSSKFNKTKKYKFDKNSNGEISDMSLKRKPFVGFNTTNLFTVLSKPILNILIVQSLIDNLEKTGSQSIEFSQEELQNYDNIEEITNSEILSDRENNLNISKTDTNQEFDTMEVSEQQEDEVNIDNVEFTEPDQLEIDGKSTEELSLAIQTEGIDSESEARTVLNEISNNTDNIGNILYSENQESNEKISLNNPEKISEITESNISDSDVSIEVSKNGRTSISEEVSQIETQYETENIKEVQEKNDNYAKSINSAKSVMDELRDKGGNAIETGLGQVAAGSIMLAMGYQILAAWSNSKSIEKAMQLIEQGKEEINLGSRYFGLGTTLVQISNNGKKITEDSEKQINTTDEILNNAIEETQSEEKGKKDNNSTKTGNKKSNNNESEPEESLSVRSNAQNKTEDTKKESNSISDITSSAKSDADESKKIKNDTEKTDKELEKEQKQLEKQIKADQKEIEKMSKESEKAQKEQEKTLEEFEIITDESEQIAEDIESKQQNNNQAQTLAQGQSSIMQNIATTTSNQIEDTDNTQDLQIKLLENSQKSEQLITKFDKNGAIITQNQKRMNQIERSTKTNHKKLQNIVREESKRAKEQEKAEQAKIKKLEKNLAVVGVANNVFSITMSTGAILMTMPWSASVGAAMFKTGLAGVISCGLAETSIQIANGNTEAGLMALGKTIVTAAAALTGTNAATDGVLAQVTQGLNIVENSATMVNNIRTVEGKEQSGTFTTISSIASVASAVTGSVNSVTKLGDMTTFEKVTTISNVAGQLTSATGTTIGLLNSDNTAAIKLQSIGGAISMAASAAQLANSGMNKLKERQQAVDLTTNTDNNSDQNSTNENNPTAIASNENKIEELNIQQETVYQDFKNAENKIEQIKSTSNRITSESMDDIEKMNAVDKIADVDKIPEQSLKDVSFKYTAEGINTKIDTGDTNKDSWSKSLDIIGKGLQIGTTAYKYLHNEDYNNQDQSVNIAKTPLNWNLSQEARDAIDKAEKRLAAIKRLYYRIDMT